MISSVILLAVLFSTSIKAAPIIVTTDSVSKDVAWSFEGSESFVQRRSSLDSTTSVTGTGSGDSLSPSDIARDSIVVSLIDYSVPLTAPTAGSVFQAGSAGFITWNATLPLSINTTQVAQTARLVLGYKSSTSVGYHLDLDNPLGINIPIFTQPFRYDFIFPTNLTTRTTYLLAFMGSSGNVSPQFTIVSSTDLGSDPSTLSTTSTTTTPSIDSTSTPILQTQTADATFPSSVTPSLSSPISSIPITSPISTSISVALASASSPAVVAATKSPTSAAVTSGAVASSRGSFNSRFGTVVIGIVVAVGVSVF